MHYLPLLPVLAAVSLYCFDTKGYKTQRIDASSWRIEAMEKHANNVALLETSAMLTRLTMLACFLLAILYSWAKGEESRSCVWLGLAVLITISILFAWPRKTRVSRINFLISIITGVAACITAAALLI
jgi:hypothetical protein